MRPVSPAAPSRSSVLVAGMSYGSGTGASCGTTMFARLLARDERSRTPTTVDRVHSGRER